MLKMMEKITNALPPQVERQQPVIFRDALNRIAPIHLEWIDSREAFLAVLKVRFKEHGLRKVANKEFVLRAAGSREDVDMKRPWSIWFQAGQRVDMSMLFREAASVDTAICPACHSSCPGDSDTEIEWYASHQVP